MNKSIVEKWAITGILEGLSADKAEHVAISLDAIANDVIAGKKPYSDLEDEIIKLRVGGYFVR